MEKNFLSLKMSSEIVDVDTNDTVNTRGSGMQWSFSNKVSALPQFRPCKTHQEERSKIISSDPASALMHASTANAFDDSNKRFSGVVQPRHFGVDRQGGNHYATVAYPAKHVDVQWTNRAPHAGMFSMNNPLFNNNVTASIQNFSPIMRPQPLGGTAVTAQHSFAPNPGPLSGNVDARNISGPARGTSQLTIFYGGSVSVFDGVPPEKAEAIKRLAGKVASLGGDVCHGTPPGKVASLGGDVCHGTPPLTGPPCSSLPGPSSISSQANEQSRSGSCGPNPEQPKTAYPSLAVPQARKASLARFLEKRKERVTNTMPYQSPNGSNSENVHTKLGL